MRTSFTNGLWQRPEWWHEHECLDDCELWRFMYESDGPGRAVSPDVRRRMALLMDRCRTWDTEQATHVPDEVTVAGRTRQLAWSLGHALRSALEGHHIACLVFPVDEAPGGWQAVASAAGGTEVFFVRGDADLTTFWRGLYKRENVPERAFHALAVDAFPALVLAPALSFGKSDGDYRTLRSWVTQVLAVVNDHFTDALQRHAGLPAKVQAELGHHGIDLSPESPNTRAKPAVIRQRQVEHEGETYDCQWHAKQHRARNRVHFSLPEPRLGGRILIGIFVGHLDT
ncbi:hypothetical protein [Streptomyces johnsoniae]|uniref:Uncharacterized protein n=1 Tax=Streptomyces johnsoniae TaxID=3075532 RepID=A0ABU2S3M5_9ACTN|nr:hypothetical protein [Streptomyces sp. DSM 41886]MDT0443588.1 hypothetical protein [Streptomyces sp. DSM 41886]